MFLLFYPLYQRGNWGPGDKVPCQALPLVSRGAESGTYLVLGQLELSVNNASLALKSWKLFFVFMITHKKF